MFELRLLYVVAVGMGLLFILILLQIPIEKINLFSGVLDTLYGGFFGYIAKGYIDGINDNKKH